MSFGYHSYGYGMYGSAAIQQLLNKPDLELEELFDEDGLQFELKTNNQRLLDFLLEDGLFKKLISYVTVEPNIEEAFDQKKIYKYPFTAADILAADNLAISNIFFRSKGQKDKQSDDEESEEVIIEIEEDQINDDTYLDELFKFLDNDKGLNVTSAGYFSKVVNSLLNKRSSDVFKYIYERRADLLEKMARNLVCKSISELLARLLTIEGNSTTKPLYLTERCNTISLLCDILTKSDDIEELNNIAGTICDILSKQSSINGSQQILSQVFDAKIVDLLLAGLNSKSSATVSSAALILSNMIAYLILNGHKEVKQDYEEEGLITEETNEKEANENLRISDASPLIKGLVAYIPRITEYLKNFEDQNTFSSTYGAKIRPLGLARLKLIELISLSLKLNSDFVFEAITNSDLLAAVLELFKTYEWNNLLHCQVEKIILIILEGNNQTLKTYLFEKLKILDKIIELSKSSDFTFSGKEDRTIKKGYNGQIVRIANKINESSDKYIEAQATTNNEWQEFSKNYLTYCNTRDRTSIGENNKSRDEQEEGEEISDNNNSHKNEISGFMQKLSKIFQMNAKLQERAKKDQQNEEENEEQVEEDIDVEERDTDDQDQRENEEISDHQQENHNPQEDSPVEGSDSDKHTNMSLGFSGTERYHGPHIEEEEIPTAEPEYTVVNYWRPIGWHRPEDILAEFGLD